MKRRLSNRVTLPCYIFLTSALNTTALACGVSRPKKPIRRESLCKILKLRYFRRLELFAHTGPQGSGVVCHDCSELPTLAPGSEGIVRSEQDILDTNCRIFCSRLSSPPGKS